MVDFTVNASARQPRTDIQALRGLAVLLVVLYHTRLNFLAAGYLGVDVFFVISGFLITGLVKRAIEQGRFLFSEFYFRRAKRLLPAAYLTFLVTAVLAPFFLDSSELRDFAEQMIGAVTFTGNLVLWQQTGYFQTAAELKPLLHVWSLAIEEQYYLILPAALVLIPSRYWLACAIGILIVSLALWVGGGYFKPVATFYLLPTRAWELAMGSIGALIAARNRLHQMASLLFVPSVIALFAIPVFPVGRSHPGPDAIIVCVATFFVILRNHPWSNVTAPARVLAWVGDFSYSLYLVHWPIFAFASNAWVGEPPGLLPPIVRICAFLLSLTLAYLLYRYVELPVRRTRVRISKRLLAATLSGSLALILISVGAAHWLPGGQDYAYGRRINFGFGEACEYGARFVTKVECRNSDRPSIIVWGDSLAMHLVQGVAATSGRHGVVQATRSSCGPFLDVAPVSQVNRRTTTGLTTQWAESCIDFNQSVVDYLARARSVEVVVLSTLFRQYLDPMAYRVMQRLDGDYLVVDAGADVAVGGLRRTITTVRALGKRVVVVAPPPSGEFDIGRCLERRAEGKLLFGAPLNCQVPLEEYHRARRHVLGFLARVPRELDVEVVQFDPALCNRTACDAQIDKTYLYRDAVHFSYDGSRLVAQRMFLGDKLWTMAR